jgi:hypothetical protein
MSDNSAVATYHGTGLTTSGWRSQAAAEDQDAPDECDMTASVDHDVTLEGPDGHAYGSEVGTKVPNLNIEHHSRPARVRSEPANTATHQNPLTAAKPRAHGQGRGPRGR